MISYDYGEIMNEISVEELQKKEYLFSTNGCFFCNLFDLNPRDTIMESIMQTDIYSQCVMNMHVYNDDLNNSDVIQLTQKFFEHFPVLKSIDLINCKAIFNDNKLNTENLLTVNSLKLKNNNLSGFPALMLKMKNLKVISIDNNPIKSFSGL